MAKTSCAFIKEGGERCRAMPIQGSQLCFWHDPEHAAEAAEASRLGGLRKKRERTIGGVYDLEGLASVEHIRRVLEIATLDALSLDNSVARSRVLIASATAAARLLEVGELAERLDALESLLKGRTSQGLGRMAG